MEAVLLSVICLNHNLFWWCNQMTFFCFGDVIGVEQIWWLSINLQSNKVTVIGQFFQNNSWPNQLRWLLLVTIPSFVYFSDGYIKLARGIAEILFWALSQWGSVKHIFQNSYFKWSNPDFMKSGVFIKSIKKCQIVPPFSVLPPFLKCSDSDFIKSRLDYL